MASISAKKGTENAGAGIRRRSIKNGEVIGPKLHDDVLTGKYMKYLGKGQPLLILAAESGPAAGTDNVECIAYLPGNACPLHYKPIGTATILGPMAAALGLDIVLDKTNNEGVQYIPGGLYGPWRTTIESTAGSEASITKGLFLRARFIIADVSGTDDFAVGFRKAEATQAAVDDYDEAAFLNVISGDIKIETILNNAATVTLDTTLNWADGEEHELEIRVTGKGVVSFLVDGATPTVSKTFTFDDGEVLVPFIYFLNDATTPGVVNLTKLEIGSLEHVK
jgi:hypothetical protein